MTFLEKLFKEINKTFELNTYQRIHSNIDYYKVLEHKIISIIDIIEYLLRNNIEKIDLYLKSKPK